MTLFQWLNVDFSQRLKIKSYYFHLILNQKLERHSCIKISLKRFTIFYAADDSSCLSYKVYNFIFSLRISYLSLDCLLCAVWTNCLWDIGRRWYRPKRFDFLSSYFKSKIQETCGNKMFKHIVFSVKLWL